MLIGPVLIFSVPHLSVLQNRLKWGQFSGKVSVNGSFTVKQIVLFKSDIQKRHYCLKFKFYTGAFVKTQRYSFSVKIQ